MRIDKQPTSLFYIVIVQMWEYFSYYGMRALLVLYLTQKLLFSDQHAYALYGAYTSLVYLTPIIGGVLADKWLGYRWSVIIGAVLMALGHIILGIGSNPSLYIGLACIICGYGLFKTNVSCLLGEAYSYADPRRDSGFAWAYVGGNLGAFLSPILVAFVAQRYGWHYGFGLAGIGMIIGLLIFLSGYRHVKNTGNPTWSVMQQCGLKSFYSSSTIIFVSLVAIAIISLLLYHLLAGWVLVATGVITAFLFGRLAMQCSPKDRKHLVLIGTLMLFGIIFWTFDQQGGSSINLFMSRNIDRTLLGFTIPAAAFQSVNAFAILIGGTGIALLWKWLARQGIRPMALFKMAIGMLVLTVGFFCLTFAAKLATQTGHAQMRLPIAGIALIGLSELFIDPVALSEITRRNPGHAAGFLAGVYMLVTGAFANYAAAYIASLTSVIDSKHTIDLFTAAAKYHTVFLSITEVAGIVCILLFLVTLIAKRL